MLEMVVGRGLPGCGVLGPLEVRGCGGHLPKVSRVWAVVGTVLKACECRKVTVGIGVKGRGDGKRREHW